MTDPCQRVAAWIFFSAAVLTLVGCVATPPPPKPIPHVSQTTAASFAAKPPVRTAVVAEVVAVVVTPTPTPQPVVVVSVPGHDDIVAKLHAATVATWSEAEWPAMNNLEMSEAGYNPYAINPSSGACGLAQFLPCTKLGGPLSDIDNQIAKMIQYVQQRYGSPSVAWSYHLKMGWY